jgi:hypothetical protein
MKHVFLIACLLATAACSMGYRPTVEGDKGAKYQADVRDCQSGSQQFQARDLLLEHNSIIGDALGWSNPPGERLAIDQCMTARGYKVSSGH